MNGKRNVLTAGLRLVAFGALATTLLFSASAQAAPSALEIAAAQGYWSQPSYEGDCGKRPPNTVCLGFEDGYRWLIAESVLGWEQGRYDGKPVRTAIGPTAKYHHVLGTDLVYWAEK